ncbi:hypothetical protein [Leifsonia xyli]|jgi:hypothetical protein|uniref:hypothetical protein n=1 Tax=Leifsonia xyli TaxID=1575 RepID=UPI00146FACBB|nr:hypothetical protein [Leifsonia xyli]
MRLARMTRPRGLAGAVAVEDMRAGTSDDDEGQGTEASAKADSVGGASRGWGS